MLISASTSSAPVTGALRPAEVPTAPSPTTVATTSDLSARAGEPVFRGKIEMRAALEMGVRLQISEPRGQRDDDEPDHSIAAYRDSDPPPQTREAQLAHRLAQRTEKALRHTMQPLLRGRNGLDAESRAELRELRRDLHHGLVHAYTSGMTKEGFAVGDFSESALASVQAFAARFDEIGGSSGQSSEPTQASGEAEADARTGAVYTEITRAAADESPRMPLRDPSRLDAVGEGVRSVLQVLIAELESLVEAFHPPQPQPEDLPASDPVKPQPERSVVPGGEVHLLA